MPGHPQARVDVAGVVPVHMPKCPAQRISITRHGNDMHMVGHQPVGPYFDTMPLSRLRQQIEIQRIIALLEKRPLSPVATLRDMVRNAGQNDAGKAGYRCWLTL